MRDKSGDRYVLAIDDEEGDCYYLYLTQGRRFVARVNCLIHESGVMDLADIRVHETVAAHKPWFLWFIPWCLWKTLTGKQYRGRGLGSSLLQHVIDYARRRGLKQIRGFVTTKDLAAGPQLLEWYARHGFQVLENRGRSPASVAARIILEL